MNVAGVVFLYNPENDVYDNIASYIDQIDILYALDNSNKINHELVKKLSKNKKVEYICNNENLGIAKVLNIAAEKAINLNYKYLLTMDQDSKVPPNMVENLLKVAENQKNIGIISPLHSNRYNTHLQFTEPLEKVTAIKTSGNLLSLSAYIKTGKFNEDLFIDYVDIEYCYRLVQSNYNVIRVNNVILEHNEADMSKTTLFNKQYYPYNHNASRLFYKTRNMLYMRREFKDFSKQTLISYLRIVAKILLFEKNKTEKIKMIVMGMVDYLKGKMGRKF
jgi:rhamnosyltransferase